MKQGLRFMKNALSGSDRIKEGENMKKIVLGMVVVCFMMMAVAAYGADSVCLYEHTDFNRIYSGKEICYINFKEIPDLGSLNMNDTISSIRIEGSLTATVYEHTDYNANLGFLGKVTTFTESVPDLNKVGWNDIISSIRISNCDFSDRKSVKEQKCFGVSGPQCGIPDGIDPAHPVKLNFQTCEAEGYATIGSIMHDNCCMRNLDSNGKAIGYMCKKGDNPIGGNDRLVCGYEWNKAFQDSSNNRGWKVEHMGPYMKNGKGDSAAIAPEGPRDGMIYDTGYYGLWPNKKYLRHWVADREKPTLDGHKIWVDVQETVVTRGLKAPAGTQLQFKEDEQFCKSGKWAAGKCQ